MKNIKYYIGQGCLWMALVVAGAGVSSCSDFFDVESTHYIDADKDHLTTATDTIYSVIGILNKVQAIGDRTILLGEMRGDLVTVTNATSSDLRDVAQFQIGDDNKYNQPRDYYAIINNCNYFIAKVDTAMKSGRNENIFLREYAAVKAIRAWTYLQLVTTYGKVPFVVEPILSEAEAKLERYPVYDIQQVCDYFINEDGLQELCDKGYPGYGDIRQLPSRMFYFPINIVLGDMNLWAGHYWEAAKCYHDYIVNRNGTNTSYPIGINAVLWAKDEWNPKVSGRISKMSYTDMFYEEKYSQSSELITMIPTDSLPSEGNYSELRDVFNSRSTNDYHPSASPSQSILDLSAAQDYWYYDHATSTFYTAPKNLSMHADGDLRLFASYYIDEIVRGGEREEYQYIYKYVTRNIHIYRRSQIYLRMAEALNRAGYPLYAFKILSTGVDNEVLRKEICRAYPADSVKLVSSLNFPTSGYNVYDPTSLDQTRMNTIGIHMRGCGYVMADTLYKIPALPTAADSMLWVEDKIVDEMALECAFEGTRFYDLMRFARHRKDNSFLADKIMKRNGEGNDAGVAVDLEDERNWYLHWNGQIGY